MLSDEEKSRILQEERYRVTVRAELDHPQQRSRLAGFVNSNFGLWLLSAIFLTGLSGGITWYKEAAAQREKTRDQIERLDVEISYRLSQQIGLLDIEHQKRTNGETTAEPLASSQQELSRSLTMQNMSSLLSLYPEFKDLSVSALMAELRRHVDAEARKQIDDALLTLTNGTLTRMANGDPKIIAGRIFGSVLSARKEWTEVLFPYTDCGIEMPFC